MKCPCCNQEFGHRYVQPALVAGRADKVYVHCMDKDCAMYTQTTLESVEAVAKKWLEVQADMEGAA
jgi:hypothetical protein